MTQYIYYYPSGHQREGKIHSAVQPDVGAAAETQISSDGTELPRLEVEDPVDVFDDDGDNYKVDVSDGSLIAL